MTDHHPMLDELQALASLAACQPDLVVKRGDPGCHWSFQWDTRVITANPEDLELRPADYCRGLILHESAHAAITRLGEIVPRGLMTPGLHHLLNVVEDCRIENWLQQRFPGCREWIALYNSHLLGTSTPAAAARAATDPAAAFLNGLLDRWWNPAPLFRPHPLAAAAIDAVWPHFELAVASFPPARARVPDCVRDAYAAHPVSLGFLAADRHEPPSAEECEIRMLQHRMWSICWQHIMPVFYELLDHPDSEATRQRLAAEARRTGTGFARGVPHPGRGNIQPGDAGDYARALARNGALIEACGDVLLRHLAHSARPRPSRFHRSGQRLDLRVAMQCEADPRQHERLWQRITLPRHPDPAFFVAVDASSSMRGGRARATFEAAVVIREVCLRLGIPLTIIAFHSDAWIVQEASQPQAPGTEARLAALLKPDGGTDLEPALRLASRLLADCPHRHRYLWILSDGENGEITGIRRLLRAIRSDGTHIHGLGLGGDSTGIATLIPGSPVRLQPHQLPEVFANLLQGLVTNATA